METVIVGFVGQLVGIGVLFRWLHVQSRDNRIGLANMIKESYTKTETTEVIDMKIKPVDVGIEHVKQDLKEVKEMLNRLLNENNKK